MKTYRKAIASIALVGATLTGGAAGAAFLAGTANAQDATTTTAPAAASSTATDPAAAATPAAKPAKDPSQGGHTANGKTEEVLTGDLAAKATAAALAAEPGATIERVETDADGATYEAHIVKADGTRATILFDADFNVTGTEAGPGGK